MALSLRLAGEPTIAGKVPEPRLSLTAWDRRSLRPGAGGSDATMRSRSLAGLDPATAVLRLSSPALCAFLARQETLARPSSAVLRACGCRSAVVALSTAIRPRWARS